MPKLEESEGKSGSSGASIVERMLMWVNEDPEFIKAIEIFFDDHCEEFAEEVDAEFKATG